MAEPVGTDPPTPGEPAAWLDGTDPAGWADTAGTVDPFPPPLDLDVTPLDGRWVDPDLLGHTAAGHTAAGHTAAGDVAAGDVAAGEVAAGDAALGDLPTDPPEALLADLAAADGDLAADWASLHESDDPAVRALAARWRR